MDVTDLATSAAGVIVPFWLVVTVQVLLMAGEAALFIWLRK